MNERLALLGRTMRWVPPLLRAGPRAHRTAADLFERQAARHPDRDFVRFEGRSLSWAEMNAEANRVAHWLLAAGLGPGDVVGLLMENRPEYLQVWTGAAKAGVTTALLGPHMEGGVLEHALRLARCRLLVVGRECVGRLAGIDWAAVDEPSLYSAIDPAEEGAPSDRPDHPAARSFDEEVRGMSPRDPDRGVRAALRGGDPLFLIYTSGTTGLPKAARMSHARFAGGGLYSLLAGFGAGDAMYCCLPLHHTAGSVMSVGAVLAAGGTLALARRFSARHFWDDVVAMEATAFQYIGELCRYLLAQPAHPAEGRHRIRFGVGNGLRPDVGAAFRERFGIDRMVEFYGATEANVSLVNLDGPPGSVGRPAPGMGIELVRYDVERGEPVRDDRGRCIRVGPGEPGELLGRIREGRTAAGRFEGYTDPAESARKVLRDVFQPGDAWFRSGDLLRRDDRGYYWFVDRLGDTFRWKGENVSTQEVAQVIDAFDGVEISAVYGVEVPGSEGRAGMAAIVLRDPSRPLDPEALYRHVTAHLGPAARPLFVRIQSRPVLTSTFKLRKVELQREGFDPGCVAEPLYWRDDEAGTYRPLDAETHARIGAGEVRL